MAGRRERLGKESELWHDQAGNLKPDVPGKKRAVYKQIERAINERLEAVLMFPEAAYQGYKESPTMKTVRRLITAAIIGFVLGVFDRDYPGVGIAIGLVLLGLWWLYLVRIDKESHDSVTSVDTIYRRPDASHSYQIALLTGAIGQRNAEWALSQLERKDV